MNEPVALARSADASLFGGKAAQLARAIAAGLPVPEGFALAWPFVDRVVAGDDDARAALESAWRALGGAVAVRSSAVGEDSAQASFAGVHATLLNVGTTEALLDAVREVRGSGHGPAASAYRASLGTGGVARVGVVVQRLLAPEVSGVLFTRNPVTGADERVIEATWGLGEALVGGLVTPDHLRVDRQGRILEQRIGEKDLLVRPSISGGTEEGPVDADLVHAPCLDEAQVAALAALASRCESSFGERLDLEWCFAQGNLHLLQQRPMTT